MRCLLINVKKEITLQAKALALRSWQPELKTSPHKKPDVTVCICNSSTTMMRREIDLDDLPRSSWPGQLRGHTTHQQEQERLCLKEAEGESQLWKECDFHTHTCLIHTHSHKIITNKQNKPELIMFLRIICLWIWQILILIKKKEARNNFDSRLWLPISFS